MSRIVQSFAMVLLVGVFSAGARGEVLITYESDNDVVPSTPNIFEMYSGDRATITIKLIALDGETDFGGGGFEFEGFADDGVVYNDFVAMTGFVFTDAMQNPGTWLTNNTLPNPAGVAFFPGVALQFPVTLATFTLVTGEGNDTPYLEQRTGPLNFVDGNVFPFTLAEGSDSFGVVTNWPEPATGAMLIVATAMVTRRRRGRMCRIENVLG